MTTAVQQLLQSFDALSDFEKQQATVEVLRRALATAPATVGDEALVELAEAAFLALDAREAASGQL